MTTDPTERHREEAEELLRDVAVDEHGNVPVRYFDTENRVASALAVKDERIAELEREWVGMKSEVQVCHGQIESLRASVESSKAVTADARAQLAEAEEKVKRRDWYIASSMADAARAREAGEQHALSYCYARALVGTEADRELAELTNTALAAADAALLAAIPIMDHGHECEPPLGGRPTICVCGLEAFDKAHAHAIKAARERRDGA